MQDIRSSKYDDLVCRASMPAALNTTSTRCWVCVLPSNVCDGEHHYFVTEEAYNSLVDLMESSADEESVRVSFLRGDAHSFVVPTPTAPSGEQEVEEIVEDPGPEGVPYPNAHPED